jgi:Tfp pilus assembly protein PilN
VRRRRGPGFGGDRKMMRRIDLLPPVHAERRHQRRRLAAVVAAGVVVLVLLIAGWVILGGEIADEEDELDAARARNARIQAEIADLARFSDLQAEVDAKRSSIRTVMTGDVDWPTLLTEVAMVIPGEVWLNGLTASAAGTEGEALVPTEEAEIRVSQEAPFGRIQFTGDSLSMAGVAKWLIRLQSVEEFGAIWLNSATEEEIEQRRTIFSFNSTLELSDTAASQRFERGAQ